MTRTHALQQLLALGPLFFGELRAITGWSQKRLDRGLQVARGPRGGVRRDLVNGRWLYRLALPSELDVATRPRGVRPGTTWSRARRAAHSRRRVS